MTFLKKLSSKYAASIFSLFILLVCFFLFNGLSVSDTYELLASSIAWGIFGIYLIIASFILDSLLVKFDIASKKNYALTYIVVGVLVWVITFIPIFFESVMGYFYFVAYGSIFTVFPFLLFYGVDRVAHQSWKRIALFGLPSLLILSFVLIVNPAIKVGFESELGENYYVAEFERFNGQETVDISVEAGKVYLIEVDWDIEEQNRHGTRVSRNIYDLGELQPVGDWTYRFTADESGTIEFTYLGDDLKGRVEISWEEIAE